jgi:hypothetical protein
MVTVAVQGTRYRDRWVQLWQMLQNAGATVSLTTTSADASATHQLSSL